LVDAIDTDGDGVISRAEFLSFIKKTEATQFTSSAVSAVTAETVDEAVELIRAKIAQRMEGGPAELRRAFQFFDADGSGTIDQNELARALKIKTMLVFKPHTLKGVYERFAEGDTGITFNTFCELLGSSRDDTTSMSDSQQGNFVGLTTAPALLKAMQRHVREHTTWKALWAAFSHLDGDDSGTVLGSKLRQLLRQHNMVFTDKQFELIAMQCVELEDGQEAASDSQFSAGIGPEQSRLVYHDFMDLFPPYH
jgi:Ca2+-binding EF-hand superfamily protein